MIKKFKLFESEDQIEKIISEIESIKHIIEDEYCMVRHYNEKDKFYIYIEMPEDGENRSFYSKYQSSPEMLEFLERLKDIFGPGTKIDIKNISRNNLLIKNMNLSIFESKEDQKKILSEIESILHILEDENYDISIYNQDLDFYVFIKMPDDKGDSAFYSEYQKSSEMIEFQDRIKDIFESFKTDMRVINVSRNNIIISNSHKSVQAIISQIIRNG